MKKLLLLARLLISAGLLAIAVPSAQAATTITFGSSAKVFAPNCFCKEDVIPYHLATYCGAKNSCNGETGTQTVNVAAGNYRVKVNVGSLTASQKYEVVIVTVNGKDYTIPDLGGNATSSGTATYDLGTLSLAGNVSFKAHHKYANIFTGKWYAENYTQVGSGDAMESIIINSIILDKLAEVLPTNGACGNRVAVYPATTTDWLANSSFCNAGTVSPANPIFPAQGGATTWTCVGVNGGTTATCQATRGVTPPEAVNGTCGTRSTAYAATDTDWLANSNFCGTGTVSPANPVFPAQGGTTAWTCVGVNGGTTATCQATRGTVAPTPTPAPAEEDEDEEKCKGEIGNYIWLDSNGDGKQDDNEKGLASIRVKLTNLTNDDESTLYTTKNGKYEFHDLCEGEYKVNVKEKDVAQYTQTYDPDGTKNHKTDVKLENNHDSYMKADFGYKGKRVAPATGSGNIAFYLVALAALIALLTYLRIKAKRLAYQQ